MANFLADIVTTQLPKNVISDLKIKNKVKDKAASIDPNTAKFFRFFIVTSCPQILSSHKPFVYKG
mgnify:CR=1 FL=1